MGALKQREDNNMIFEHRDFISIQDEEGQLRKLAVEALFDMDEQPYALLKEYNDMYLMRVENEGDEQYLVSITDPTEQESILDAYEIALEATTEVD